MPRLAVRFALTTLLGFVVAGACVAYLVRGYVVRGEEASVATHAQLVTRIVLARDLRSSDFAHVTPERAAQLARLLRTQLLSEGVVAAALYSAGGRPTVSTDNRSATTVDGESRRIRSAARRHTISHAKVRRQIDGRRTTVLDEFVPVSFAGGVRGVILLSNDYGRIVSAARRAFVPIAAALELLLAILFVALLPVIRRTASLVRRHLHDTEMLALRDELTGLPNRTLLEDRAQLAIAQSQRDGRGAAVMLIDLDHFKEINDTLGHAAGDRLLQEIADRLSSALRDADTVARIGGDEFAVVLSGIGVEEAREMAARLHEILEAPLESEGLSLSVGASIGIALHPDHGDVPAGLMRHADVAMYEAKRAGLGYEIFEPSRERGDAYRREIAADLRSALDAGEIVLHYQPRIDLSSGEPAGVEALLRWQHPRVGVLPAERFIALADQAGVARRLRELALEEAVRQAGEWRREGLELTVAVNLDAKSLVDRGLPGRVDALLDEHGVEPEKIEVEISETAMLADVPRVRDAALALASRGIVLVVDDFGTGNASLNTLVDLPIGKVKIHGSFVTRAAGFGRDRIVVATTVELAHRLGLEVVAEAVEDETTLDLVRRLGADYAQGYHVGAPAAARTVAEDLAPLARRVA